MRCMELCFSPSFSLILIALKHLPRFTMAVPGLRWLDPVSAWTVFH